MEKTNELINKIIQYFDYLMQVEEVSFVKVISSNMGVILSSLVAIISVIWSIQSSRTDYKRRIKEKEHEKYTKELEEFYYPFLYLLGLNTSLYSCFALKEKAEDANFRTLIVLINQYTFSDTDQRILDEIILNNRKINKLILEKGLYVEKQEVRDKLIQLSTHYTIIDLAYEKKITDHRDEYDEMVFPRDIHTCISTEISNIEDKLMELR